VVTKLIAAAIISALVVCAGAGAFYVWKFYPWVFLGNQTVRIATLPAGSKGEAFLSAFMGLSIHGATIGMPAARSALHHAACFALLAT